MLGNPSTSCSRCLGTRHFQPAATQALFVYTRGSPQGLTPADCAKSEHLITQTSFTKHNSSQPYLPLNLPPPRPSTLTHLSPTPICQLCELLNYIWFLRLAEDSILPNINHKVIRCTYMRELKVSFANNARQRQAPSHVSSLDDAAGLHWLDVDDLSPDLPSQQAFV